MSGNPSALGAIEYEAESSFGEDVTTFATFRLPIRNPVDVSGLIHEKMDTERTQQHRQGGAQWVLGPMGGTIRTRMYLPGHGSATSGATSLVALETLLGIILGNAAVSAAAGTTFTGGTAGAPTTSASSTFATGSMGFAGVLGDGRGNGQAFVVSDHSGTNMSLNTALPGNPSNGDLCASAVMLYPNEMPTDAGITSCRLRALTGNLCYELHGCVPTAISISGLETGKHPEIEVTWSVAWWRYTTSGTFPSAVATSIVNPGPNCAGTLFLNDVGTATRAVRTFRNFTLDYQLGVELLPGPGGVNAYQRIVGARRIPDQIKVSWTEDADAATTSPVLPGWGTGTTSKHALLTCSTAAGSRIAIYFPNLCISNVALQRIDSNINRLTVEAMAYTGTVQSNNLTASAMRMAFA